MNKGVGGEMDRYMMEYVRRLSDEERHKFFKDMAKAETMGVLITGLILAVVTGLVLSPFLLWWWLS